MFIEGSFLESYFLFGLLFLTGISLLAGYVDAIAGGAGLILIPAFMVAGIPPQVALGQEKLVSTIGTIAAIKNFMNSQSIIWRIVPLCVITALTSAYIGAQVVLMIPTVLLKYSILGLLPFILLFTLLKNKFVQKDVHREDGKFLESKILLVIVCSIIGFYDGFLGPGTGSLFIIALFIINKFTFLNASATSKIFNFSSNIGAFVTFFIAGKMLFLIGIPMIIANLFGNYIGSKHAIQTNGKIIQKILIITVVLLITTLLFQIK